MDLETKFSKIEAEAVTSEGVVVGYASLFGVEDMGGDVVETGAFAKSLTERAPRMLWDHDPGQPIGKWTKVVEDQKGLYVEGQLALSTIKGRDVFEMLKSGIVDSFSIGYRTEKAENKGSVRLLKQVGLFEISVVSIPMLPGALVSSVKAMDDIIIGAKSGDFTPLKRAVEIALRDAGFPAWLAKAQAALAPQALSDGSRDASASEIAKLIKDSFKI